MNVALPLEHAVLTGSSTLCWTHSSTHCWAPRSLGTFDMGAQRWTKATHAHARGAFARCRGSGLTQDDLCTYGSITYLRMVYGCMYVLGVKSGHTTGGGRGDAAAARL